MERCHEMPCAKKEQHIRDHKFRSKRKLNPEMTRRNVSHPPKNLQIVNEVSVKVTQLCPTLCDPMDYTVHGILHPEYWDG